MQTDPISALQIKLTDYLPIHEIEKETEAKAPNVSLLNICETALFSEELQTAVDQHFITQLKTHDLYDQFIAKQPSDNSDLPIAGFFSFSSIQLVKLIETNDFEDILNHLTNRTQTFDLIQEQKKKEVIREVVSWRHWGILDELPNLPIALRGTENNLTA